MTNNKDASCASNVTNFETLISSIVGYGPAYNSSNPLLIGVLTYHWAANLQTLSPVNYIKNKGRDAIIINWIPSD